MLTSILKTPIKDTKKTWQKKRYKKDNIYIETNTFYIL
jgi:hypothetical protein